MNAFPGISGDPPREQPALALWLRQLAGIVSTLLLGKLNCTGTVTLTASQISTTVADPRADADSAILLVPVTANAAAAVATTYISARSKRSFTLTHASAATVDRTFVYSILG